MGANDKAEATYHGRTPDTQIVEHAYVAYRSSKVDLITGHHEFKRWVELVKTEAKAEALVEAATELNRLDTDVEMYDENERATQVEWWLRKRAEQIRGGS